jgi:TRAP-type C4-dicarboxylate transport system permease large subunit
MSSRLTITLLIFFGAMFAGVPLTFSMLLACIVYLAVKGQPIYLMVQQFFAGVDTFMLPAIFIIVPILMPLATELGINPVHFGVVVVFNLLLGLLTPPYGTALFAGSMVTGVPLEKIVRNMWPFFLSSLAVLFLITYVPELVLFLPRLFGLDK